MIYSAPNRSQVGDDLVKALVFLAPGFEEIEVSTIVDVLRRCDVMVTVAGLVPGQMEGSHGMKFSADIIIGEVKGSDFDAVVCPGGGLGSDNLRKSKTVLSIIKDAFGSNKLVAAICAAPAVLADAGILEGRFCTIYPGMEAELQKGGGKPKRETVVVDGNVVTSMGPATALPFALKLGEKLAGAEIVEEVKRKMLADLVLKQSA